MKRTLLLLAAFATSCGLFADEWTAPVFSGSYQPLTPDATVYIYNTGSKNFLTEGNDWGTHATVGATGLPFVVKQYVPEGGVWDNKTYIIEDKSVVKEGWKNLFITDGGHVYVDRAAQEDYFFSFKDLGSNTYEIFGADINPTWNTNGDLAGFVIGHWTGYFDEKDAVQTGTGVIYDYYGDGHAYGENEFFPIWAFVNETDYNAYQSEVDRYDLAMLLKAAIDEATTMGMTGIDEEKAIYANTASSTSELQSAITSINTKKLAYYETYVTPTNPVTIETDECNSIDSWTNEINASTWGTQSWIDGSWEGFEGTTLNIWSASLEGKVYKQKAGLPKGIYVIDMAIYSQSMEGYAYANENKKSVGAGAAGQTYSVTTEVTDGTLEYGFGQETSGTNWVAIDNAVVKYYGSGVEAYRFWLNGLLEAAPNFNDVTVTTVLLNSYNELLASVNTAETKEQILAIIPAYEAILNEIGLNIEAWEALKTALEKSTELGNTEGINAYYGGLLNDSQERQNLITAHTLSTDEVKAETEQQTTLNNDAQQYLWNMETLASEVTKAATVYEEFSAQCSLEAAMAYDEFVNMYNTLNTDTLTCINVENLTKKLYQIEFDLQVPAEPASDENPVDYTAKVQYPSFDAGATGWTNDGWATCGNQDWNPTDGVMMDGKYLNLWNVSNCRVYQTIADLPEGTYIMQISAFADAEGMQVYANNDVQNVIVGQNNEEGTEFYGVARVFGETTSAYAYEEGETPSIWYGNVYQVITTVGEDGIMEIGIRNAGGGTIWGMVDNVKLTYYGANSTKTPTGTSTDIDEATSESIAISGIYSISGTKLPALKKGINIVMYSNGTVRKMLVKKQKTN